MKTNAMLATLAAATCLASTPLMAQEIEVEEDVAVDRRVVVIETDDAENGKKVEHKVRVVRRGADGAEVARELDEMEKVEVRIVKMGEGADLSEAELRALTEERLADREMIVFSGREMECERQATGEVRLKVCSSEGRASVLKALREARGTLATETSLGDDAKARALAALDRRIVELETATED